jgi:hypothetical protein
MIVVGDRTSFVIAVSEVNGAVSRTIAANHRGKIGQKGASAPCLTDRVMARAHDLGSGAAGVDICPHGDPINPQIEPAKRIMIGVFQDFQHG